MHFSNPRGRGPGLRLAWLQQLSTASSVGMCTEGLPSCHATCHFYISAASRPVLWTGAAPAGYGFFPVEHPQPLPLQEAMTGRVLSHPTMHLGCLSSNKLDMDSLSNSPTLGQAMVPAGVVKAGGQDRGTPQTAGPFQRRYPQAPFRQDPRLNQKFSH